jgi:hypothetical protein
MAGEPFLRAGTDERDWVQYLQQLLQYWGWWDREHDGVFGPELEAAVQGVQLACGIPATGAVDEATWIVLTADETTIVGHDAGTAPAEEVPASFSVGGVPAFQYNWPLSEPVAATEFETGAAHVKVELYLKGSCTVTFPNAPPGITVDVMSGGMRAQAAVAVGQLTEGLRINGLGTETPSLGATVSSEFYQAEVRFIPPAIVFIGSAKFSFEVESESFGTVVVQGAPSYELKVTVIPHAPTPELEPVDEPSWFSAHRDELLVAGGVIVLIALAWVLAPETAGGSLVLLEEAAALAPG